MSALGNILVIDDDADLLNTVGFLLREENYDVTLVEDGRQAIQACEGQNFDLLIVDLKLPDTDGLSLIRMLKEKTNVGIIILSGLGEATDRVIGLEVGADDYVVKPYDSRELLARVRSVLRRASKETRISPAKSRSYVFEGWKLSIDSMRLTSPAGEDVGLTSGEFSLLKALVESPNIVLSRDQLLDHTHKNYTPAFDRSVDVQVGRLRKKIEQNPKKPKLIKTVRNSGYIFSALVVQDL